MNDIGKHVEKSHFVSFVQSYSDTMQAVKAYVKWTTIVLNIFIVLIAALATVAAVLEHLSKVDDGYEDHVRNSRILEFVMASVIIPAAIYGCYGAYSDNKKALTAYSKILMIPLICHIGFILHHNVERELRATEEFVVGISTVKSWRPVPMDHLQQKYECCGEKGALDYINVDMRVPQSCFNSTQLSLSEMHPFDEGCIEAVQRAHLNIYRYVGRTHTVLATLEIVCLVLATILCQCMRKRGNNNENLS